MSTEMIPAEQPELRNEAMTLAQQAQAIVVHDQNSYDAACEFVKGTVGLRRKIETYHKPLKQKAYESWKAICAAENSMLDPVVEAEKAIKDKLGDFVDEQARIRAEEQERLEAAERQRQLEAIHRQTAARSMAEAEAEAINDAARRRAEEYQEAAAALAEAQGATPEEVQAILQAPIVAPVVEPDPTYYESPRYVPPPRIPPQFERAPGVATRELWSADVVDMKALCAAIGRGEASTNLVQPNQAGINMLARVEKAGLRIPGLRAVKSTSVAVGGK